MSGLLSFTSSMALATSPRATAARTAMRSFTVLTSTPAAQRSKVAEEESEAVNPCLCAALRVRARHAARRAWRPGLLLKLLRCGGVALRDEEVHDERVQVVLA